MAIIHNRLNPPSWSPNNHMASWTFDARVNNHDDSDDDEIICIGESRNGVFQPSSQRSPPKVMGNKHLESKVNGSLVERKRSRGHVANHDDILKTKRIKIEGEEASDNAEGRLISENGERGILLGKMKTPVPRFNVATTPSAAHTTPSLANKCSSPAGAAPRYRLFEHGIHALSPGLRTQDCPEAIPERASEIAADNHIPPKDFEPSSVSCNATKIRPAPMEDDSESDNGAPTSSPPCKPAPRPQKIELVRRKLDSAVGEAARSESSRLRQEAARMHHLGSPGVRQATPAPREGKTHLVAIPATSEGRAVDLGVPFGDELKKRSGEATRPTQEAELAHHAPDDSPRALVDSARYEADEKRRSEWERKDRGRQAAEQKKHHEEEEARAAQRQTLLTKQMELTKQQEILSARACALEKLQDAKKAAYGKKHHEKETRRQQSEVVATADDVRLAKPDQPVSTRSTVEYTGEDDHRTSSQLQKPISLRKFAEQSGSKPLGSSLRSRTDGDIGELRPEDVNLVRWRDTGMRFSDIATQMRQTFNTTRDESWWQQRYKKISAILKRLAVPLDLLNAVNKGSEQATRQLNALVQDEGGTKPTSASVQPRGQETNVETLRNTVETPRDSSKTTLGEITPQDVMVLKWKDDRKSNWRQIVVLLQNQSGVQRGVKALRRRYSLLKEVLESVEVDETLLDAVSAGDVTARRLLNEKVHGEWPLVSKQAAGNDRPRDAQGHFVANPKPTSKLPAKDVAAQPSSPETASVSSKTLPAGSPQRVDSPQHAASEERPQQGGKTITTEVSLHYLQSYLEMKAEEEAERSRSSSIREPSPMTDRDFCHFVYHVHRRQLSDEEILEGRELDDMPWFVCGEECEDLGEANARAVKEVLDVRGGVPDTSHKRWALEHEEEEGQISIRLRGEATGTVQVRVGKSLRTFHDGRLPQSKERWIKRTCYQIWYEKVCRVGDDLFEEAKDTTMEMGLLDKQVFTTSEIANEAAVKLLVARLFPPPSGAQSAERRAEMQQVERQLLDQLDESEGELFDESAEDDEGRMRMRVWVEESAVVGPRNLH